MKIRRMRREDFPQVLRLLRKTQELSVMREHEYVGKKELESLLRLRATLALVAAENNEVLGFAFGLLEPLDTTTAWLYNLAVKRSARNRGIGTALLAAYEKALKARGVRTLLLYLHDTKRLKKFYRKTGYRISGIPILAAIKRL